MTEDYVIYDPTYGSYAEFDWDYGVSVSFGSINHATGFNCPERALDYMNGSISPTGRVLVQRVPELSNCVVRKRYMMAEDL